MEGDESFMGNKAEVIFNYMTEFINDHGYPPTVREICAELDIKSTSTVHRYLKELEADGRISMGENQNRAITLKNATPPGTIPVLGHVAAGSPILAEEEVTEYVPYPGNTADLFALHVHGNSMIKCGILDGDIVIVRRTPEARNGEIVVALVDDSATVKRFYKEDGHFRLQPENDDYEPIIVDSVDVLGKVISVVRSYD
ncbi:MAG: transcriptional repressor LexA [Oscillospiraceae bacterium]|nr:transcriptional repressor LexA [Oscillospiraceae bacterium]MBQ2998768.1 transcriptional repressor LexA [Oscillospiraceae bacterium]MBQ6700640.1 transcriptional repressor LexA [Oscillospiraceae bacterium]MBQ6802803.1 transcriptional repressor LexA [Oscillospiraceae bacterium]